MATYITHLEPHQVLVFGSNLAGKHSGGAALQAKEQFGAEDGVGEGLTGKSYAFPTLDAHMAQRKREDLEWSVKEFYRVARANPNLDFLFTKVGCGIAGYDERSMMSLFTNPPANVVLPFEWR